MGDAIFQQTICQDPVKGVGGVLILENRNGGKTYVTAVSDGLVIGTSMPIANDVKDLGTLKNENVAYVAVAADDDAADFFSWQNTTGKSVVITRLVLVITTKTTNACTVDCGMASTEASADNLIDGLDINTATGTFDNIIGHGTNGKAGQVCADNYYVTGSKASGATAGVVGYALIHYVPIS